jgi:hypothetical protein
LVLKDCDLVLKGSASSTIMSGLTMSGGSFRARRSANVIFGRAQFEGVRFFGRYLGCDFGDRERATLDVANCDFSNAWLHLCRFKTGAAETCRFAPWPTVVVLDPQKNAPKLLELVPPSWRMLIDVLAETPPGWGSATIDIREATTKYGESEDALRAIFTQPYVLTSSDSEADHQP